MYSPEWEIEELIAKYPELLGVNANEVTSIERQKHLKKSGKCMDLLIRMRDFYIIAEIKATFVDDVLVITNQLLPYKTTLAEEFHIPEEKIQCFLVSSHGFSNEVKEFCQKLNVATRIIDKEVISRLSNARDKLNLSEEKSEVAKVFLKISNAAPIMAHEVYTESDGKLRSNKDMWFWLFYSVMDRRANAATFVKAKEALEKEHMFAPYKIVSSIKEKGEKSVLNKIAKILERNNFPLLSDSIMGKWSFPKSIIDAAKFISHFNYDFMNAYENYVKTCQGDLKKARDSIWNDLQKHIYGVGPRIASQIIRGLVLKGPWRFPLDDNKFLEKCRYNVWMAGETRLCLIKDESEYCEQLGSLADKYLNGNRGIIAHVLWFIRKRYCNRPPKCHECPLRSYCSRTTHELKHKEHD
ncbi:MAG: hypothetical protein RMJ15_08590 [Nitrososphaerota archaeon]|nr:hypothetical protein [Candidatus Bathyarchaeota archaeon]MDW8023775.1 hypothetical protein [Nitrososphaerota archaeon]